MPTTWLQERPNGSKNDRGIGFEGPGVESHAQGVSRLKRESGGVGLESERARERKRERERGCWLLLQQPLSIRSKGYGERLPLISGVPSLVTRSGFPKKQFNDVGLSLDCLFERDSPMTLDCRWTVNFGNDPRTFMSCSTPPLKTVVPESTSLPTSHTPHPAPHTPHPTPHTPHPTPHTVHSTPHTQNTAGPGQPPAIRSGLFTPLQG